MVGFELEDTGRGRTTGIKVTIYRRGRAQISLRIVGRGKDVTDDVRSGDSPFARACGSVQMNPRLVFRISAGDCDLTGWAHGDSRVAVKPRGECKRRSYIPVLPRRKFFDGSGHTGILRVFIEYINIA